MYSKIKILLAVLFVLLCISPSYIYAQTITGKVIDAQTEEALAGASVVQEGTQRGTSTGPDGSFSLTLLEDKKPVLAVRFIGYSQQTYYVEQFESSIVIELKPARQKKLGGVLAGPLVEVERDPKREGQVAGDEEPVERSHKRERSFGEKRPHRIGGATPLRNDHRVHDNHANPSRICVSTRRVPTRGRAYAPGVSESVPRPPRGPGRPTPPTHSARGAPRRRDCEGCVWPVVRAARAARPARQWSRW